LLFVFQLSIVFRWFVLGECLLLPRVMILRYVIDVRYLFSSVDPYLMLVFSDASVVSLLQKKSERLFFEEIWVICMCDTQSYIWFEFQCFNPYTENH
jgi:hypothetical protein